MNQRTWNVARFRFRATFARRRSGYLALVLLVALLGGLAMGAVAAARRTQSSFPEYLAKTRTFQLSGASAEYLPGISPRGYDPGTTAKIARLPHVTNVANLVGLNAFPLNADGSIRNIVTDFGITFIGAVSPATLNQNVVTIVAGHFPRLTDRHAFIADQAAVRKLHLHLGETLTIGVFSNAQEQSQAFGTPSVHPVMAIRETLAGIFVSPTDLIEDDVDRSNGNVGFLPPFTRPLLSCCVDFTETSVEVRGGAAAVASVRSKILQLAPKGAPPFTDISVTIAKAERAMKPESIAIGAFGVIVALAALLVAGQLIGRQFRAGAGDTTTMRALGADPAMTAADGLAGVLGSIVVGALLAVAIAVALSPLAPLGPVRPYDRTPGVSFDWTVLVVGAAILVVFLVGVSVLTALRYSPRRMQSRSERGPRRGSQIVSAVSTGLPAPALVGVRFALEPGASAEPVPVRSVILAAILALIVVMSTLIFGASLNSLVSHPPLYGWNWNYELASEFGSGNISQAQATRLLAQDHDVAAWSGAYFITPKIDGQIVPVLGQRPGASVAPPVLTGHGLSGPDQIVLGAITLAELHKHVGDTVKLTSVNPLGAPVTKVLRVVGTATMPTIGQGTSLHLEMGSGAEIPSAVIPAAFRTGGGSGVGPEVIFVRLKNDVSQAAALPGLRRIAAATANQDNDGVLVEAVQRPAEIVNYRTLGATPAILGAALAVGTVVALALTLLASVRRRRRELAMLKTLGFTRIQLAAAVACQATVAVAIGIVVGVTLGIVAGRYLWDLFANEIHAVPAPSVSVLTVFLVTIGALVLGNVVALIPGRIVRRARR